MTSEDQAQAEKEGGMTEEPVHYGRGQNPNSRANLSRTGRKASKPEPRRSRELTATRLASRIEEISTMIPVRDADNEVPKADRGSVLRLARVELELDSLDSQLRPLTIRQERRREKLEALHFNYSTALGLTTESRAKLATYQAQVDTANRTVRVEPLRTEERAMKVALLLAASGALPEVPEVVPDDELPELPPLHAVKETDD